MNTRHPPLVASLSPGLPMALTSEGIAMVFRRNLTDRQVKRAFDLFHLAAIIETPDGYYHRKDFDADTCADSPAGRVYAVIAQVCAGDKGLNLPEIAEAAP